MTEKKLIDICKQRVPLKQLLHGKEIREAMAALEKFRQKHNEKEFFYGAKVYLSYYDGECWALVKRPETDKELATRLAAEQKEREAKAERKRQRELKAAEKERRLLALKAAEEAEAASREVETLRILAEKHGLKLVDKLGD